MEINSWSDRSIDFDNIAYSSYYKSLNLEKLDYSFDISTFSTESLGLIARDFRVLKKLL
jgi:hypothetical protein